MMELADERAVIVEELMSGRIVVGGKGPRHLHIPPHLLSLPHVVGFRQEVLLMRLWLLEIVMVVERGGLDVFVRWWRLSLTARNIGSDW